MPRSTGPKTPAGHLAFRAAMAAGALVAAPGLFAQVPHTAAMAASPDWGLAAVGGAGLLALFAAVAVFSRRVADREKTIAKLEADLAAANEAAGAADRTKGAFLANMGHELLTPLNAIIGYSEMLLEEAGKTGQPPVESDLRKILSSSKRLLGLANDILALSQIEAGRTPAVLEEIAIGQAAREAAAAAEPLIAKNGNTFEFDCGPGIGSMRTDAAMLRQTLLHLLGNAAKFTENGRISLRVSRGPGGMVSFAVADTGTGIDPQQAEKLFAPFVQADPSPTRKYGGIGAGLALGRHFCRMLGGDITVESALGKGSTFTAILPSEPQLPSPCQKS